MTTLSQLHPDWLDALAILRRAVPTHDIRVVWEDYAPEFNSQSNHPWLITESDPSELGQPIPLLISVKQDFDKLPKIERVEILVAAAATAWGWENWGRPSFNRGSNVDRFIDLCRRAGCWHINTPEIRERWRLLDFYAPADQLPCAKFEDRPRCKICSNPVATEAGAWVKFSGGKGLLPGSSTIAQALELEAWQRLRPGERNAAIATGVEWFAYHPNVHEECMRYAHMVLVPQVKAAKEAREKASLKEVDK